MTSIEDRFSSLRQQYWPSIADIISSVVGDSSDPISPIGKMCASHLGTGGKRLRAILPLLVAEQLGMDPAAIIPFGAACEMLHNATLVHDDLQDGDRVRRNKPTIWVEYGMPQAINLGDAMFYFTLLCVARLEGSAELRERVSQRVLRDTLRVIDGQALEFVLKAQPVVQLADYLRMVEGKTSGLFSLPMSGAAEIAGASRETVEKLAEAARHLGVLFQIQDDVLDLYGQKGRESIGNDIREGKRSALAVHLLETATLADRDALTAILDTPRENTTDLQVDQAILIFERCGSRDWAIHELIRRRQLAVAAVERHPKLQQLVLGLCSLFLAPIAVMDNRL